MTLGTFFTEYVGSRHRYVPRGVLQNNPCDFGKREAKQMSKPQHHSMRLHLLSPGANSKHIGYHYHWPLSTHPLMRWHQNATRNMFLRIGKRRRRRPRQYKRQVQVQQRLLCSRVQCLRRALLNLEHMNPMHRRQCKYNIQL